MDEIDWKEKLLVLPPDRTKNGREHRLPLTDVALDILRSVPKLNDEFVFPARGRSATTFSGFSKCKAQLDKLSGVSGWVIHDLRRSTATHLARLGVAPHVIEAVLNHLSGSFAGVAGVYNRQDYSGEMRQALTTWASYLEKRPKPEGFVAPTKCHEIPRVAA